MTYAQGSIICVCICVASCWWQRQRPHEYEFEYTHELNCLYASLCNDNTLQHTFSCSEMCTTQWWNANNWNLNCAFGTHQTCSVMHSHHIIIKHHRISVAPLDTRNVFVEFSVGIRGKKWEYDFWNHNWNCSFESFWIWIEHWPTTD